MSYATVHLFQGSELKNYNQEDVPTKDQLNDRYPDFTNKLKRGDMLENIDISGYRSIGVYMWNGKEIIPQNTEYDDYGSPAKEFKVITQFPPDYWSTPRSSQANLKVNNSYVGSDCNSGFYWHIDNPPLLVDLNEFVIIKATQEYWILLDKDDNRHYHVLWVDNYIDNEIQTLNLHGDFYVWYTDLGFPNNISKDIVGDRIPLYVVSNKF
jgi:hypothetical protein